MIEVEEAPWTGSAGTKARIVVLANLSMSWHANLVLAASIAFVCLGVAFTLAALGFWMVIPFAGLEVAFVTACLYWTVRKLSRQEVITINERSIRLEWGYNKPEKSIDLPRRWSQLKYRCLDNPFDVGFLSLQVHGKGYPLGTSLGRVEKKELYQALKRIL